MTWKWHNSAFKFSSLSGKKFGLHLCNSVSEFLGGPISRSDSLAKPENCVKFNTEFFLFLDRQQYTTYTRTCHGQSEKVKTHKTLILYAGLGSCFARKSVYWLR